MCRRSTDRLRGATQCAAQPDAGAADTQRADRLLTRAAPAGATPLIRENSKKAAEGAPQGDPGGPGGPPHL
ncbi:hypothetical protein SBA4_4570006 [Candidatus Sulfopaludibacter sp. SbA4]|nr:hypothetical protein SBA4_4570006 [Candidatus Sulfopaludibacter sp. SbA4]